MNGPEMSHYYIQVRNKKKYSQHYLLPSEFPLSTCKDLSAHFLKCSTIIYHFLNITDIKLSRLLTPWD